MIPIRPARRLAAAFAAFGSLLTALPAGAQSTVADPFRDPHYMSGHREIAPPAVPEELRDADALTRISALKRIVACADPYAFPATENVGDPLGFDVDLVRALAAEQGWEAHFVWVNTADRGGLNRAFRTTIRKGVCDVFLGLGTGGSEDVLERSRLSLMAPSFGVQYVYATFDAALKGRTPEQLGAAGVRAGATYFTPGEKALARSGIAFETFPQARRAITAMAEGKVQVVLIPSTSMADARRDHPGKTLHVISALPAEDAVQWNNTWATQTREKALRSFLEARIAGMAADGRLKTILGRYGIPWFPPVGG